ncbi:hypothetical protein Patl1_06609 [Pistacia atlantica]|uniref:Uncharacterized protein n=1 Tax=Pistacia atlantica TaxID=434234 RepID=A0ACC1BVZ9_9ROSI|nr:hypothetical protein Patl1_06609 [Pistacia atlantica]
MQSGFGIILDFIWGCSLPPLDGLWLFLSSQGSNWFAPWLLHPGSVYRLQCGAAGSKNVQANSAVGIWFFEIVSKG